MAAAKSASCRYLLTEDFQAGQDLVIVATPPIARKIPDFAAMRREILGDRILPGADLLIEEREKSRY